VDNEIATNDEAEVLGALNAGQQACLVNNRQLFNR
jgi:hypothetical protein